MCKISDKSDKFLLNYSNLFRGPLFFKHSVQLLTARCIGLWPSYKTAAAAAAASNEK